MKMAESSSKRVENTMGKREIACYEQFLLFPVFSKDLYCRYLKTMACLDKGLHCGKLSFKMMSSLNKFE